MFWFDLVRFGLIIKMSMFSQLVADSEEQQCNKNTKISTNKTAIKWGRRVSQKTLYVTSVAKL